MRLDTIRKSACLSAPRVATPWQRCKSVSRSGSISPLELVPCGLDNAETVGSGLAYVGLPDRSIPPT